MFVFEFDNLKLPRPLLLLIHQLEDLKRFLLSFLLCLPTSLLALTLIFLLACNGFFVFCIHLPFLATNLPPQPSNFSLAKPVSNSSSSFVMYVVREDNPPTYLKTPLPSLPKNKSSVIPLSNTSIQRHRRLKKHRRKLRSLRYDPQLTPQFSEKIRDFFSMNCEVRFFMTWISSHKSFGKRELLALQSLFKSNPNGCLVIVSDSKDSNKGNQILRPFAEMGFKVMTISPDYNYLFKNTEAESWFNLLKEGNVDPGEVSLGQNLSNLLRLTLLYKFGGIYVDTDVIVLKSLSNLRNVIGAQTLDHETGNWTRLNNAVLIFDKNHPLLFKFIQEFALTFDGNKWGHNGPYLVSRVVSRVSGRPGFNFTVLPPSLFYPVDWSRIEGLFKGPRDEIHSKWLLKKLKQIRSQSFAVHLWNKQSRKLKVENGSIIYQLLSGSCIFCNSSVSNL